MSKSKKEKTHKTPSPLKQSQVKTPKSSAPVPVPVSAPAPVTPASAPTPVNLTSQKPARTAGSKRAEMQIEIVSTPTMKSGTDRELCFATISSAEGKLTVAKYLELAAPKCRKPRNASWYLGAFVSEGLVKLVEPPTKA